MLERIGLIRVRDGLVREFSRGMRQRLAVGRVFLHDPEVLLLDEPFQVIDARYIELAQRLIASVADKTILFVTHNQRELPATINQIFDLNTHS